MPFRFQRRIKVLPGLRVNLSKSGASVSVGPRGASVTIGKRGTHANVGLPGTGLSYRERLDPPARESRGDHPFPAAFGAALLALVERVRIRVGGRRNLGPAEHPQQTDLSMLAPPVIQRFPPRPTWVENFTARDAATEYEDYVKDLGLPPRREAVFRAVTLLIARERGEPLWKRWAAAPVRPIDDDDDADPDELEAYARRLAMQRFARRMEAGDRAAWAEVLQTELSNEELPFGFAFDFAVEDETDRIRLGVELPTEDLLGAHAQELGWGKLKLREAYEDVCCGLVLRVVHEVYRVIPEADDVVLTGYLSADDPATGHSARAVLIKIATDRESFTAINLDAVDPSTALAHLGAASKKKRGMLVPLGYEVEG